ncbi:39S ribosomal protein L40, mitochondrial [Clonorchis sinensis]|uniref:Large ribosomal subunit protein mL40 n=1 Tax=Clonorchis sinensis TaxID=79923 RepID=A0A8T1LWY3_CLOSI|nr:39S ribosomal protein L40, mitochondrial [Clonorchis sinensis]
MLSLLSRLLLAQQPTVLRTSHLFPSMIHTTAVAHAEPLKKKKRIDPLIEQNRVRRRTKKIEKEIKRFNRQQRQLKPVAELEGDRQLFKELEARRRQPVDLSENELDRRAVLLKQWGRYQTNVAKTEFQQFSRAMRAQQRALDWLYLTSPELYKAAIQPFYLPTTCTTEGEDDCVQDILGRIQGPYYTAPRIHGGLVDCPEDYEPPDGEAVDTTPEFTYEFELDRKLLADPTKKKSVVKKQIDLKEETAASSDTN